MVKLCPQNSFPGKTTEPGVPLVHLGPIGNPAQGRQSIPWNLERVPPALSEPGSHSGSH